MLLALVLLHGYIWWRMVRSTTAPGRLRRRLTLLTVLLALLPAAAVGLGRAAPKPVATVVEWIGFSWLGLAFYLFLALLALEPVRLAARLRRRSPQPAAVDGPPVEEDDAVGSPRRVFLARSLAVTAGVVAGGTAGTGVVVANSAPRIERVPVRIRRLDPAFDGFRIVTFSDVHLSATYGGRRFERLVEIVNRQRPDVVAIVGDLVDGSVADLREDVAPLADLVSEQGVYFVTGNHEYFVEDTEEWLRYLPRLGVDVLHNERVALSRGNSTLDLAGIDDRTAASSGVPGQGADLGAALDGRDDATPVVLLAHQPVLVDRAAAAGVDLQLSGHTHGGQLWPFGYVVGLDQPSVAGLSRVGDTQLYVTRGAGYWGPPMRVGATPEVTVVELRSDA